MKEPKYTDKEIIDSLKETSVVMHDWLELFKRVKKITKLTDKSSKLLKELEKY